MRVMVANTVGEKIREAREEAGLSLRALAELVSLSRTALHNWENGRGKVTVEGLYAIAKALNKSLDYFLAEVELTLIDLQDFDFSLLQVERDIIEPFKDQIAAMSALQEAIKARYAGRLRQAAEKAQESRQLWQDLDDPLNEATALVALGDIVRTEGDWETAETHYKRAVELLEAFAPYKAPPDARRYAQALWAYSRTATHKGQYEAALELLAKAKQVAGEDPFSLAVCNRLMGNVLFAQGETVQALQAYTEGLVHARQANHPHTQARCLAALGRTTAKLDDEEGAARHLEEGERISREKEFHDVLQEIDGIRSDYDLQ